jgi:hypothetical protein
MRVGTVADEVVMLPVAQHDESTRRIGTSQCLSQACCQWVCDPRGRPCRSSCWCRPCRCAECQKGDEPPRRKAAHLRREALKGSRASGGGASVSRGQSEVNLRIFTGTIGNNPESDGPPIFMPRSCHGIFRSGLLRAASSAGYTHIGNGAKKKRAASRRGGSWSMEQNVTHRTALRITLATHRGNTPQWPQRALSA